MYIKIHDSRGRASFVVLTGSGYVASSEYPMFNEGFLETSGISLGWSSNVDKDLLALSNLCRKLRAYIGGLGWELDDYDCIKYTKTIILLLQKTPMGVLTESKRYLAVLEYLGTFDGGWSVFHLIHALQQRITVLTEANLYEQGVRFFNISPEAERFVDAKRLTAYMRDAFIRDYNAVRDGGFLYIVEDTDGSN